MANTTKNYGLTKPLPEEFYDIGVHNANMDVIDAELKRIAEETVTPEGIGAVPVLSSYYTTSTNKSADDLTDSIAIIPISEIVNKELFNILGGTFAYVRTYFYISTSTNSRRMQIAYTYNAIKHKMAIRLYGSNGWLAWQEIATTADAVLKTGGIMTGGLTLPQTTIKGDKMTVLLAPDPSASRFNIMAFENGTDRMVAFTITPNNLFFTDADGVEHSIIHSGNLNYYMSAGLTPATIE